MLKRPYLHIFLFSLALSLSCSAVRTTYSPFTSRLIQETDKALKISKKGGNELFFPETTCKRFLISKTATDYTVNGLIIVNKNFHKSRFAGFRTSIKSLHGNTFHAVIPVIEIKNLGKLPNILHIEIDTPVKKK